MELFFEVLEENYSFPFLFSLGQIDHHLLRYGAQAEWPVQVDRQTIGGRSGNIRSTCGATQGLGARAGEQRERIQIGRQ